jgi:hypothetical protein
MIVSSQPEAFAEYNTFLRTENGYEFLSQPNVDANPSPTQTSQSWLNLNASQVSFLKHIYGV